MAQILREEPGPTGYRPSAIQAYQRVLEAADAYAQDHTRVSRVDLHGKTTGVCISKISLGRGPRVVIIAGTHSKEYSGYTALKESFQSLTSCYPDLTQHNTFDFYATHPDCVREDRARLEQKMFRQDAPCAVIDLHSDFESPGYSMEATIAYDSRWASPSSIRSLRAQRKERIETLAAPALARLYEEKVPIIDFRKQFFPAFSDYEKTGVTYLSIGVFDGSRERQQGNILWGDPSLLAALQGIPAFTFETYANIARPHTIALDGVFQEIRAQGIP